MPRKSQPRKAAKRMHAHGGPLPGQMDGGQKSGVWKQDDVQGSSFSKVVGPAAARLRRIRKGGVEHRGRQQVQSTCQKNVTVREKGKRS